MRLVLRRVRQLQRLAVFEAVGRLGSYIAAAAELAMSQPAVSKQMKALEGSLGTPLVDRRTNRRSLTRDGTSLHQAVTEAFDVLEGRLARREHPFRGRPGAAPALRAAGSRVRGSRRVPRPGPTLGARPQLSCRGTARAPLVHVQRKDWTSQRWSDWFAANGLEYDEPADQGVFPTYGSVVPLAISGNGIILSWRTLIGDHLSRGLLPEVGPVVTVAERGYSLHWSPALSRDPSFALFRSWLHDTIEGLA